MRQVNLRNNVLTALQKSNLHLTIDGKKIVVLMVKLICHSTDLRNWPWCKQKYDWKDAEHLYWLWSQSIELLEIRRLILGLQGHTETIHHLILTKTVTLLFVQNNVLTWKTVLIFESEKPFWQLNALTLLTFHWKRKDERAKKRKKDHKMLLHVLVKTSLLEIDITRRKEVEG